MTEIVVNIKTMATVNIPVTIPLDMVEEFKTYLESKYMVDSQWCVTPQVETNVVIAHKYLKDKQGYIFLIGKAQGVSKWLFEDDAIGLVGDAILEYFKTANGTWQGRSPLDLYLLHRKAKPQAKTQANNNTSEPRDYDNIPPPPPTYIPPRSDADRNARLNSYINRKERTFDFTHSLIGDEI